MLSGRYHEFAAVHTLLVLKLIKLYITPPAWLQEEPTSNEDRRYMYCVHFLRNSGIPDFMYTQKRHWTRRSKADASQCWSRQMGQLTEKILQAPVVLIGFAVFFSLIFPSTAIIETVMPTDGKCVPHFDCFEACDYGSLDNPNPHLYNQETMEANCAETYRNADYIQLGAGKNTSKYAPTTDRSGSCELFCMRFIDGTKDPTKVGSLKLVYSVAFFGYTCAGAGATFGARICLYSTCATGSCTAVALPCVAASPQLEWWVHVMHSRAC